MSKMFGENEQQKHLSFFVDVIEIAFHACTVKTCGVLKVKNALLKYVHHVTEYSCCSLVAK